MSNIKEWESLKESLKKFIIGRWFPLFVGIICLALLVFGMAVLGLRITYAPELENSWSAISAFADWGGVFVSVIGVIASFVAIWYAIQVPKKIADRQDKIALFEKRYECFQLFEKCYVFYSQIKDKECTLEELRERSKYLFDKLNWVDITKEVAMTQIQQYEYVIHQMEFLFPGIEENDTWQLYMTLQTFLVSVIENKNIEISKEKYIDSMSNFCKKNSELIFDALRI